MDLSIQKMMMMMIEIKQILNVFCLQTETFAVRAFPTLSIGKGGNCQQMVVIGMIFSKIRCQLMDV